jgi:hypothetical protein
MVDMVRVFGDMEARRPGSVANRGRKRPATLCEFVELEISKQSFVNGWKRLEAENFRPRIQSARKQRIDPRMSADVENARRRRCKTRKMKNHVRFPIPPAFPEQANTE